MQVRFFPLYHGAAGVPTGIFPPCAARLHRSVARPSLPGCRPLSARNAPSAPAGAGKRGNEKPRHTCRGQKGRGRAAPPVVFLQISSISGQRLSGQRLSGERLSGERPVQERGHLGAGADASGEECVHRLLISAPSKKQQKLSRGRLPRRSKILSVRRWAAAAGPDCGVRRGHAGRHRRLLRPCRPLLPVGVNGTEALFARPRMGPRFSCAPLAVFAPRKARYIHYNVYPVPVYHRIPRCPLPPPARRERRAAQVCLAERTI